MLIESFVMLLAAAAPAKAPAALTSPAEIFWRTPAPSYAPDKRAVDNWRFESAMWLEMGPLAAARRAIGAEDNDPARCVKLNNYWCVKHAGWNGEIAADADGHVAFASAEEGAAVAALLLRRYYVDYNRRTARAIVERWAPAQCSPLMGRAITGAPASRAGMARMMPQRVVPMGIAPRGIQNTVRARWLAAHGRGGVAHVAPPMTSGRMLMAQEIAAARARAEAFRLEAFRQVHRRPPHPLRLMPAPSIMQGVAESGSRQKSASRPPEADADATVETAAVAPEPPRRPAPAIAPFHGVVSCSGELVRIANYAARIADGVVAGPNEDLQLFNPAGQPTDNLAKVLANMASVEIGPARPRTALVTAAVAQLRRLLEDTVAERAPPPRAP
jgi:hypothetical protein